MVFGLEGENQSIVDGCCPKRKWWRSGPKWLRLRDLWQTERGACSAEVGHQ